MALNSISTWSYFSGTNAVVSMDNVTLGEAAAIQYRLNQNRVPLYGYNAPLFNAVADGQILVQGLIAVNYVTHAYLLAAIQSNINAELFSTSLQTSLPTVVDDDIPINTTTDELILQENPNVKVAALKSKYWGISQNRTSDYNFNISQKDVNGRPDQYSKSVDITVKLGTPDSPSGTQHILKNVFFLGRALNISISEDPLVETFEFFARNII